MLTRMTLLAVVLCLIPTAAFGEPRTWRDSTGKFSVEAELVEVKDEKVVLKKANGKSIAKPCALKTSRINKNHCIASLHG